MYVWVPDFLGGVGVAILIVGILILLGVPLGWIFIGGGCGLFAGAGMAVPGKE